MDGGQKKSGNLGWKIIGWSTGLAGLGAVFWTSRRAASKNIQATNGSERLAAIEFCRQRERQDRRAMRWAMGWSAVNLGWAIATTNDESRDYFHAVNGSANLFSGCVALAKYVSPNRRYDGLEEDVSQVIEQARQQERVLALKLGTDLIRIAIGGYLWGSGHRSESEAAEGAGRALLWQGAALAVLDVFRLGMRRRHRERFEAKLSTYEHRPALPLQAPG